MHAPAFARGSGMLNGVGHKFVHDERERNGHVSADDERIGIDYKWPGPVGTARRGRNLLTKVGEVPVKHHRSDIIKFLKLLVNSGDGRDTGSSVVELTCCGARCSCLQMQKARHNLQAVFDAVIDLLHQQVFLPPAFLKRAFCLLELLSLVEIA